MNKELLGISILTVLLVACLAALRADFKRQENEKKERIAESLKTIELFMSKDYENEADEKLAREIISLEMERLLYEEIK